MKFLKLPWVLILRIIYAVVSTFYDTFTNSKK